MINPTQQRAFIEFAMRTVILNQAPALHRQGVSFPGLLVLFRLAGENHLEPTKIARLTGRTTAGATSIVQGLEKKGLLTRSPSPTDRRKVLVQITSAGLDLVQSVGDSIEQQLRELEEDTGVGPEIGGEEG